MTVESNIGNGYIMRKRGKSRLGYERKVTAKLIILQQTQIYFVPWVEWWRRAVERQS